MRRRGFTFIELLGSISIIVVLAAILFPVFAKAREKARQTSCLTNLQQIGIALSIYARDHCGHYPPTDDDLSPLLGLYLPMEESLCCPTAAGDPARDYWYEAGRCDDDEPTLPVAMDSNDPPAPSALPGTSQTYLTRHNEGVNCLFVDGHTKWMNNSTLTGIGSGLAPPDGFDEILRKHGIPVSGTGTTP